MVLNTKEHIDLMNQFERDIKFGRFDKEEKELWVDGHIYQDGEINNLFRVYRLGYSFRKSVEVA